MDLQKLNILSHLTLVLCHVTLSLAGWGYVDQSGWSALHGTSCGGTHQSPINLPNVCLPENYNVTRVDPRLNLRLINYDMQVPASVLTLRNNGHSAVVSLRDSRRPNAWLPKLSGSVVNGDKYQLLQLHFHWDSNKNSHMGSEHALHGTRRAFEMHLVHFNTKYPDPVEAGLHPDGFAVLGTFFDDSEDDEFNNQELNKIVFQLREITEFNTTVEMKRSVNLRALLPADIDTFYTYQGSLTTPPCSEIITWVIFTQAQKIGPNQLFSFERALDTDGKNVLSETCRDVQPLNDRIVIASSDSHCNGNAARPATSLILENVPNSVGRNQNGRQQQNDRQQQNGRQQQQQQYSNSGGENFSSSNPGSPNGRQQYQNYPSSSSGSGMNGNYGSRPDRYINNGYYQESSNNGGQATFNDNGGSSGQRPTGNGRGGRVEIVYGSNRNPVTRRPGLVGGLVGGLLG